MDECQTAEGTSVDQDVHEAPVPESPEPQVSVPQITEPQITEPQGPVAKGPGHGPGEPPSEDEPGYGIGAVSRRLGVPAPTLRTWNLRYGIGPSRRSPGGHRRYDSSDVRRLEEMNRLIRSGVPPADAARHVRPGFPGPVTGPGPGPVTAPCPDLGPGPDPGPDPAPDAPLPASPAAIPPARTVPSAAALARWALALDTWAVGEGLRAALARHGVPWTWDHLVRPALTTICRRQTASEAGIDAEHLFSDQVLGTLYPLIHRPAQPANARPVLLACAANEQHSLAVYALAAALTRERGLETLVLGARTPYSALADAMRRLGPTVVFVWSQRSETGDPTPLATLPALRPPTQVVVGGPGWQGGLPARVDRVTSLEEAIARISAAFR
jgi:hypothetical protein